MSRCVIVADEDGVTRQTYAAALRQASYEVVEVPDAST